MTMKAIMKVKIFLWAVRTRYVRAYGIYLKLRKFFDNQLLVYFPHCSCILIHTSLIIELFVCLYVWLCVCLFLCIKINFFICSSLFIHSFIFKHIILFQYQFSKSVKRKNENMKIWKYEFSTKSPTVICISDTLFLLFFLLVYEHMLYFVFSFFLVLKLVSLLSLLWTILLKYFPLY